MATSERLYTCVRRIASFSTDWHIGMHDEPVTVLGGFLAAVGNTAPWQSGADGTCGCFRGWRATLPVAVAAPGTSPGQRLSE